MNDSKYKIINIFSLFSAIILYHLSNFIKPEHLDLLVLFKIVQYAVLSVAIILFIYSKWLAKLLYRKKYIGGKYEGTSELIESNSLENKSNIENLREPYFEKFEIKQNLYHIKILGKSLTLNKKSLISTWSGNLFKQNENIYFFAIELDGAKGVYGILKITYEENEVHGIYYSANPEAKIPSTLYAKRLSK